MNVLVLIGSAFCEIGGIQTFNRTLIHTLDAQAEAVEAKAIEAKAVGAEPLSLKVSVLSINDPPPSAQMKRYYSSRHCEFRGFSRSKAKFIAGFFKRAFHADVIICGHVNFAILTWFFNTPKALIVHGIEAWLRLSWWKRRSIMRMSRILSVSDYTTQEMIHHNSLPGHLFRIIPETLDPFYGSAQPESPAATRRALPQGRMLLSVGRTSKEDKYKNIDLIIRSIPALLEAFPETFLVVVGDGIHRKELERVAVETGVESKVHFLGWVSAEELASLYSACEVFILPSTKEGFGIVFLEAMYYSKVCIGARAGGIPQVIKDGETGFLVDISQPGVLARRILELFHDHDLRTAMGQNGKRRLEALFSLTAFARTIGELLDDLAPANRRSG